MNKVKIDYNSVVNQNIKKAFVQREVLTCFSCEMDEILRADLVKYDDIENLYYTDKEILENYGIGNNETAEDVIQNCYDNGEDVKEIYEWWIVTEYFYRKLKEQREPVLKWGNNYYWGRTTTGQAISLDSVISEICEDLEILEGQKYSWEKNI